MSPPLVPSVANLRDLGGLCTASGRRVVSGRLYRSSHFTELAPGDAAALAALGLRTVVDLRGVEERASAPGPALFRALREVHLPIEPRALRDLEELRQAGMAEAAAVPESMYRAYRRYAREHTAVYAALLRQMRDPASYPLLFHCTAGKDRTGFGAVLVLLALGVERELIVEDYLVSNARWATDAAKRDWTPLARAGADYLEAAFETMRADWGSIDAYLAGALGLDASAREQLAGLLLAP